MCNRPLNSIDRNQRQIDFNAHFPQSYPVLSVLPAGRFARGAWPPPLGFWGSRSQKNDQGALDSAFWGLGRGYLWRHELRPPRFRRPIPFAIFPAERVNLTTVLVRITATLELSEAEIRGHNASMVVNIRRPRGESDC